MITVKEADKIISAHVKLAAIERRPLEKSLGAVLREDIISDRPQPPFDKATMDGIAITSKNFKNGQRCFSVAGTQPAGVPALKIKNKNACVEIMTGAVVPTAFDCVVPIEQVDRRGQVAIVQASSVTAWANVRRQGDDCKKGARLLNKGAILTAPQIGIASSVGKSVVSVSRKPRVAIISTGDEIVDIAGPIQQFQIRKSNSYALKAVFEKDRLFDTELFHIVDNKGKLKSRIAAIVQKFDVLVLSGGVSMGKFDYVPEVLKDLGVKVLFHKVNQKPGKPFWFGKSGSGKLVFALPGNPVSTLVCAYRYALPHLKKSLGINAGRHSVVLAKDFEKQTSLTYFLPVRVEEGKAYPVSIGGSGDFAALANSDGFVELSEKTRFKSGEAVPFYSWK